MVHGPWETGRQALFLVVGKDKEAAQRNAAIRGDTERRQTYYGCHDVLPLPRPNPGYVCVSPMKR